MHQTGLAYHVYPSARHSRFEHSLGAATIASRVFDAVLHKQRGDIRDIARAIGSKKPDIEILRFKQELRLAALLHDTGHSLFSHTSERVFEGLKPLVNASKELSRFVGKQKGAGEVLSFCLTLTPAVSQLLDRAGKNLIGDRAFFDDYNGPIDLNNVALIIVGRSGHPFLQFLGDIVSSGFDADKLDYLLRDATAAGLPLKYDIDRYLYDVRLVKEFLADGDDELKKLYSRLGHKITRLPATHKFRYPNFETYRLRLSRRAMNVIEQIVICKMMLFSYIYHHGKVRASEGLLERLLRRNLKIWKANKETAARIMIRFLEMTDSSLPGLGETKTSDRILSNYTYRLVNRFLPREVYSISGPSASHASRVIIQEFLLKLHDKKLRESLISDLERAIGVELIKSRPELGTSVSEALAQAGVWVDAPTPPKFEDIDTLVGGSKSTDAGVAVAQIFPIRQWTEAYEHYRYQVRIFSFSEYWASTRDAAKTAMKSVLKISGDEFYDNIRRGRS
ncbi:MAG: HD domain-containing protein [Stellaceae bacterium]